MAFRDEVNIPGGIYYEGDDKLGDRTDVSIIGVGMGKEDNPYVLNLNITTGSGSYLLCSITIEDMIQLGRWISNIAHEKAREMGK